MTTDMERYADLVDRASEGRRIVRDGHLRYLRLKLGFSQTAMADLIGCSLITYRRWEHPDYTGQIQERNARTIATIHEQVWTILAQLQDEDVVLAQYRPISLAAMYAGVPQEVLLARYRDGEYPDALDLGILGLWLPKEGRRR